jgi:hypothetical protein
VKTLKLKGRELNARSNSAVRAQRRTQLVTKVIVDGAVDIVFRPDNEPSLMIAGQSAEAVETVKVSFRNNTMFINSGVTGDIIGNSAKPASVFARLLRLLGIGKCLDAKGCRITVCIGQHTVPNLTHKGTGTVLIEDINQHTLLLGVEGVVNLLANGKVFSLNAEVEGTGKLAIMELMATTAHLTISGTGSIQANVSELVTNKISGTGTIVVAGNPMNRSQKITGTGRVEYV